MTCDAVRLCIPEYLSRDLPKHDIRELEQHIDRCSACREEMGEMTALWESMARLPQPEPSPMLRARFEDMLSAYEHGMQRSRQESAWRRLLAALGDLWPRQPAWQFSIALICLAAGFAAGSFGIFSSHGSNNELASLRGEIAAMRQLVALSLLQQQSPSDRLRGVNWSVRVERPTPEVPAALLYTVGNDENVNVRLSAVDALHSFASDDRTRRALAASLPKQDSPLVQIAIIELLSQLHDPETAESLERFASNSRVDRSVRDYTHSVLRKMRFE